MKTVKQILEEKGCQVWSVAPTATMFEALTMMAEREVGALTVLEGDKLVGIISERDYARKVILRGRTSRDTLVQEIMSSPVICVHLDQTVDECMALMTGKRFRHLPVLEEQKLVGIVSIGDLVHSMIEHQQFYIAQLESYISG